MSEQKNLRFIWKRKGGYTTNWLDRPSEHDMAIGVVIGVILGLLMVFLWSFP